jgi:glutathione synthase/RimK-type ligase-like ATP-grasp enzyme
MADIAMVYDRSETDELGIRLVAEEMGIDLEYLPFYKVAVGIGNHGFTYRSLGRDYTKDVESLGVILNRTQSKNRRIFGTSIFESLGKDVLNPLSVELSCQSKMRTLLSFYERGIRIPETVYIPSNVQESRVRGGVLDNLGAVSGLIAKQLGVGKIVTKPDAGTHGRDVRLSENHEALRDVLVEIAPSITNPSGVVAQEFIPKWFYDLRIVVEKKKGEGGFCHPTALARGGFKDFRTNTYLGNTVFRASLPAVVQKESVKCGEALGSGSDSWIIALDAMPYIGEVEGADEAELRSSFDALEEPFKKVLDVKRNPNKKRDFAAYTKDIEYAYTKYMSTEPYYHIKGVIDETLEAFKGTVLFHEGNACPEFWEQTRIVGGVNLAESLMTCAKSLLDR